MLTIRGDDGVLDFEEDQIRYRAPRLGASAKPRNTAHMLHCIDTTIKNSRRGHGRTSRKRQESWARRGVEEKEKKTKGGERGDGTD